MLASTTSPAPSDSKNSAPADAPAVPKPIDSMDAAFATWSHSRPDVASFDEPPPPPTASQEIRDAVRAIRRARLTRIVRGVVVASALLCVAGVVSKILRSTGAEEAQTSLVAPRPGSAGRDVVDSLDALVKRADALSARTMRAMKSEERRAAAHVKGASRHRWSW